MLPVTVRLRLPYGLPRDGLAGLPGGLLLGHFYVQAVIAGQVRDPEIAVHGKADGAPSAA